MVGMTDPEEAQRRAIDAQDLAAAGRSTEAIAILEEIVQNFPGYDHAVRALGYQYSAVGRMIDAIHMLDHSAEMTGQISEITNVAPFRVAATTLILDGLSPNAGYPTFKIPR